MGVALRGLELAGLGLEHLDELAADDLALGFGVGHAGQVAEELRAGVDMDHPGVQLAGEHLHHHRALVQAQQAMVDEDAGQLVADRAVDQRCGDAGVNPARQAQDHLFVTHLLADLRHRLGDVVAHHPVGTGAANLEHKALEHHLALQRVRHLGMELHGVKTPFFIGHACDCAARRAGHAFETRRHRGDLVAVAHPDFEHAMAFGRRVVGDAVEQPGVAMGTQLGVAELAVVAPLDHPAELGRHRLHAVADAQHRDTEPPQRVGRTQLLVFVSAGMAARQDHPFGGEVAQELFAHIAGMDFAVHMGFAHPAGDQLGDLRAEV